MTEKSLSAILASINAEAVVGSQSIRIRGITYDSRRAREGWLFCALPGIHTDGKHYIPAAIAAGARAVLYEGQLESCEPHVSYVRVADVRRAMSALAAELYDHPDRRIPVIGVTGTDGKSSTVYFIHQLLSMSGAASGFLSTVAMQTDSETIVNPFRQSTPEATEVHEILHRMIESGKKVAVVEATSHGLSKLTSRLSDVSFAAGVLTNVTHEHLEFHGTFEQYRDDKANLFRSLSPGDSSFGVVNVDDKSAAYFASVTSHRTYGYSIRGGDAELSADTMAQDSEGISFSVNCAGRRFDSIRLNTPGAFNVENVLAALIAAGGYLDPADPFAALPDLLQLVPRLVPVKGRLTPVRCGQPFGVMVDYAHTPGAFAKVLPMMRSSLAGRLIVVFGSGGERDRAKRPLQGEAASAHADIVILSDEDPRGEDRMAILEEIAAGCVGRTRGEDLFLIPDRREAVRKAVGLAAAGDLVLLLGKGHEYSIIYPDGPMHWDEEQEARDALAEIGYVGMK